MDQLGFLVYFSREGNSACLVAHLGSLVCFFRPEKSVYLMDQLESLVCLSPEREKKVPVWWINGDLLSVFYAGEILSA